MTVADICNELVYQQRQRVFCIKSQSRCDRSIEAFTATLLGFQVPREKEQDQQIAKHAEAQRKKIFDLAGKIRVNFEKAGDGFDYGQWGDQVAGIAPMILRSAEARTGWDVHRADVEKRMKVLARQLPAWPFVQTVRGFSELGLAVLVGECGDLGNYATPARLWKRLGLAVMDGARQGIVPKGTASEARADAWKARGYVPRRRAEVFVFCDDLICRAQWRAEKTDDETGEATPAHAIGQYGEIYARKKAEYIEREWTPGHADKAARRYMAKCFIVDLQRAWKANAVVDVPTDRALFYRREMDEAAE